MSNLDSESSSLAIEGGTDSTLIGNVGDRLKTDASLSSTGNGITFADDSILCPFDRMRVSNPTTLFQDTHRAGKGEEFWDEVIAGSATSTHNSDTVSIEMDVTSATGDKVTRATHRYFHYSPGKGQLIFFTSTFGAGVAGVKKCVGYFDELDGLFFKLDGTTAKVVKRSSTSGSAVDTEVSQASWDDPMDGTGASGITLDLTKKQIFIIDLQWLGSGEARFGFSIAGKTHYCHTMNFSNVITVPYMTSGSLPLRAEIENVSAIAASELIVTCFTVISEGGNAQKGFTRTLDTGTTELTINATEAIYMGLRLRSAFTRFSIQALAFDVLMSAGNNPTRFRVLLNPTITTPSWSDVPGLGQALDSSAGFSGGTVLASGYVNTGAAKQISGNDIVSNDIFLGRDIGDTPDELVLTLQTLGGTSKALISGSYREFV